MKCLTICMNRKNRAASQFKNYNFAGLMRFKGRNLACNKEGLYLLGGDKDMTAAISAQFKPLETDFGMNNVKALRFLYFGLDTADEMLVEVTPDDSDDPQEYAIVPSKEGQQRVRIPIKRTQTGRYFGIEVSNQGGKDFSVDSIQAFVKPLSYGHR